MTASIIYLHWNPSGLMINEEYFVEFSREITLQKARAPGLGQYTSLQFHSLDKLFNRDEHQNCFSLSSRVQTSKEVVTGVLETFSSAEFHVIFRQWLEYYNKCIEVRGSYFQGSCCAIMVATMATHSRILKFLYIKLVSVAIIRKGTYDGRLMLPEIKLLH